MINLLNVDKQNIKLPMPDDVKQIIRVLEGDGNHAFIVGGCVRDTLLGRTPGDWDIATSALPMQVKSLFRRTVDTGIKHGTVTVMMGSVGYEVTTYRIDGEYLDGRHPESVEFSVNLLDDLARRDFTINAMAYNQVYGLIDEFQGLKDLNDGMIRCVGVPEERFSEDALRMMRAIRFSAQLGFRIHEETKKAIVKLSPTIVKVSMERVHDELRKTLLSDNPDYVKQMSDTGLFRDILPVVDRVLKDRKCRSTLVLLKKEPADINLRLAALLNQSTPDEAYETLRDLKLDNATTATVTKLVKLSRLGIEETEPAVREAIHEYGREFLPLIIRHQQAIIETKEETTGILMPSARKHNMVIRRLYDDIIQRGDCISIKELDIDGNDLKELGISGARIGEVLNQLLHIVMENPKLNDKATLIAMIEGI